MLGGWYTPNSPGQKLLNSDSPRPRFKRLFIWLVICVLYRCCSVAKSYPALCDPMNCSIPGFSVLQCLPEFAQTHVSWVVGDAIQPPHPLSPPSPPALNLSQPMNWLFTSGDKSTGASASASVLPMNTQDWSPLGWTGLISLLSKGLWRVFSSTTIQKH